MEKITTKDIAQIAATICAGVLANPENKELNYLEKFIEIHDALEKHFEQVNPKKHINRDTLTK